MNGPIKMYRTRPIVKHDLAVKIPECMYSLKNIHSRGTKGMLSESSDHVSTSSKNSTIFDQNNQEIPGMADLVAKQEEILKQLGELKNQLQSMKLDLKIQPTSSATSKNLVRNVTSEKLTSDLSDLVVNASATHPPFSLEILQKILHDTIDLKFSCHLHSSVAALTDEAQNLQNTLLSHKAQFGVPKIDVRLIWKNVGPDTEFIVSRAPLKGEVNLLRYLTRAVPSKLSYTSDSDSVEIDSILDTCYLIGRAKTKSERTLHLQNLNKSLGKSEWLGGRSKYSVADIAAYSSLKQAANTSEINANLSKWYKRCETICCLD